MIYDSLKFKRDLILIIILCVAYFNVCTYVFYDMIYKIINGILSQIIDY